ncbi:MAG: 2-hydroxyacyl-CoA dehydratase family protein [Desulfosarcinaceae bacterium]
MPHEVPGRIGYACAYTPLTLIDAAGLVPYRILPLGDSPDRAGQLLHTNLCPHVKRILDRALANDLPEMTGLVVMSSCDAMRRLGDAWHRAKPADDVVMIDLPATDDEAAVAFFAGELRRLTSILSQWSGRPLTPSAISGSIAHFNELANSFAVLGRRLVENGANGRLQELYNQAATQSLKERVTMLMNADLKPRGRSPEPKGVPILAFGNVLPDPEVFERFAVWGAAIVDADFCTGSRQFAPIEMAGPGDMLTRLARGLLRRPRCARTLCPTKPGAMAEEIRKRARAGRVRGVIAYAAKFCDPYMTRIPAVKTLLDEAGLPLLQIEGDGTLGSMGQQRTRIEAFIEMLRS